MSEHRSLSDDYPGGSIVCTCTRGVDHPAALTGVPAGQTVAAKVRVPTKVKDLREGDVVPGMGTLVRAVNIGDPVSQRRLVFDATIRLHDPEDTLEVETDA